MNISCIRLVEVNQQAERKVKMPRSLGSWVRGLRKQLKLNQTEFSERVGVGQSMISKIEAGAVTHTSQATLARLYEIASRTGYPVDGVALAIGADHTTSTVAVVGYVGAGAEVRPIDSFGDGGDMDRVNRPDWLEGEAVALVVRGDSMHPIKNGWTLFYTRNGEGVDEDMIGQLCVCETALGEMYVKEIHRGSENGLFNLVSWNAPILENQSIKWAAKVSGILPN